MTGEYRQYLKLAIDARVRELQDLPPRETPVAPLDQALPPEGRFRRILASLRWRWSQRLSPVFSVLRS